MRKILWSCSASWTESGYKNILEVGDDWSREQIDKKIKELALEEISWSWEAVK